MVLVIWANLAITIYSPPFQKNRLLSLELKENFLDISSTQLRVRITSSCAPWYVYMGFVGVSFRKTLIYIARQQSAF